MKYFINRICYSLYCMGIYIDKKTERSLSSFIDAMSRLAYYLDVFGEIKRKNISKKKYKQDILNLNRRIFRNIDNGYCIQKAHSVIIILFTHYIFLLVTFLKYERVLPLAGSHFMYALVGSGIVSYVILYVTTFRNDIYKEFFKAFGKENDKDIENMKWNIITVMLLVGSLLCFLLSIVLWN